MDYICPEMVLKKDYDYNVDLWCLGILCYEFVTGSPPFESNERKETFRLICKGEVKFPSHLSNECRDLIRKLLNKNPKERLSLKDVINHNWIKQYIDYNVIKGA
jgi:serine/threonine protein kinase